LPTTNPKQLYEQSPTIFGAKIVGLPRNSNSQLEQTTDKIGRDNIFKNKSSSIQDYSWLTSEFETSQERRRLTSLEPPKLAERLVPNKFELPFDVPQNHLVL